MVVGSLLPFGFWDEGEWGLVDRDAVFGFRYGGPIVGRLLDGAGANRWAGDAWITVVLGLVVVFSTFRARRGGRPSFVPIVAALVGVAVALYDWSYWLSESGTSPIWTEYHTKAGPGPVVAAVGATVALCAAALLRLHPNPRQESPTTD